MIALHQVECANCHEGLLHTVQVGQKHPSGSGTKLGKKIASNDNAYVRSGHLNGDAATAYLALVPFETGTTDTSRSNPLSTGEPDGDANVMCLTCHRAPILLT